MNTLESINNTLPVPEYYPMEHILIYHTPRAKYATGGDIKKLSKHGRFGDTELAYVPKHIADALDKKIGMKSINPHTGLREYWLATAAQVIPAVANMMTAPPPPHMKGIQGSLTTSLGGMLGGLAPKGAEGGGDKYMRALKGLVLNNNPSIAKSFIDNGYKPAGEKFNSEDVRKMELAGLMPSTGKTSAEENQDDNIRDAWVNTREGRQYYNNVQQNLMNMQQPTYQDMNPYGVEQQQPPQEQCFLCHKHIQNLIHNNKIF